MANEEKTVQPKKNIKKIILIGLGTATAAVGGFFAWKKWFAPKSIVEDFAEEVATVTQTPVTNSGSSTKTQSSSSGSSWFTPSTTTTTTKSEFPLKKGSRGDKVKTLQQTLISKYGKTILPKYGADGDFGSEMVAALKSKNLPEEISESAYNLLVKGSAPDPSTLALKLYTAATKKDFTSALSALKQIRDTSDYSKVSDKFETYRIDFGVRKTLVTGMLDTFTTTSQKDAIRMEFLRMGLKYDGSKWSKPSWFDSVSGLEHPLLITTMPTELIDPKNKVKVKVPVNMVVGYKLKEKDGYILLRMLQRNLKLIVKSSTVKIYEKY